MDATRREDGRLVSLKTIRHNDNELDIALSLTSPNLIKHSMNHCVRILDTFVDPLDVDRYFLVMPYLRPYDDPPFGAVGEAIDFVRQTLEVRQIYLSAVHTTDHDSSDCRVFASFTVRMSPTGEALRVISRSC